jgi:hypothetical protein
LARSLFYFAKESSHISEIRDSMLGHYNEKPLYIPNPISTIVIESAYTLSNVISEDLRNLLS